MYLVGDIGGTKTNLAWAVRDGEGWHLSDISNQPSGDWSTLGDMIAEYVADSDHTPDAACFGIAGPVINGRVQATNLPWIINESQLASQLGCKVRLLNDLEALGHSIAALPPSALLNIHPGESRDGNRALIAAGTGLGEAILFHDGQRHQVSATEGGHCDFAPQSELEIALLRRLMKSHDHVSVERFVCGDGLAEIYAHLRDTGVPGSAQVEAEFEGTPRGETVSKAALKGACARSELAMRTFVALYGAEAGNLALKAMATGGIYIGGGIAPKILERMTDGTFLSALQKKGRFTALVSAMPVNIILDDHAALLGSAAVASHL